MLTNECVDKTTLTWSALNWSAPKEDTLGLIPPVPRPIRINPTAGPYLKETVTHVWISSLHHLMSKTLYILSGFMFILCVIPFWWGEGSDGHHQIPSSVHQRYNQYSPKWEKHYKSSITELCKNSYTSGRNELLILFGSDCDVHFSKFYNELKNYSVAYF